MWSFNWKTKEKCKTAAIIILALCAVYLSFRVQTYTQATSGTPAGSWLKQLASFVGMDTEGVAASSLTEKSFVKGLSAVRIAVRNANGRYGVQYDRARTDQMFNSVGNLLGEAIGSASEAEAISQEEWREALNQEGVYFDFLGGLPFSALSEWFGAENGKLTGTARRLLLSVGSGETATLYYIDEESGEYYGSSTAVPRDSMNTDMGGYMPNGASFAFELGETYRGLPPETMILPQLPELSLMEASNPLQGEGKLETLLKACEFNPYTNSRYIEANGTEVINENLRTLRISQNATVVYHNGSAGDDRKLRVSSKTKLPTEAEMIEYTLKLAERTIGGLSGEGSLYLIGTKENQVDGSYRIRFGYMINGAAVHLYEDGFAAEFTIEGQSISDFTLYIRNYTQSSEKSLILPERQVAAALDAVVGGKELSLAYVDYGGETVSAGWIVR